MAAFTLMALLAFILVFLVTYALLTKTKILGNNDFIHFFSSLLIAIIFVASPGAREFTLFTMPWLAIMLLMIFIILLVFTFVRGNLDDVVKSPAVSVAIIVAILVIFITAALNVFGPFLSQYMPGPNQTPSIISFLLNPAVLGGIALIIIAAIASRVLTNAKD